MSSWWSWSLAGTLCMLSASCGHDYVVQGSPGLSTGQNLAEIVAAAPSGLVALVSPAECLTCDRSLRAIVAMQRDSIAQVAIVYNRRPTDFERRRMILEGLPFDAAVLNEPLAGAGEKPVLAYGEPGGLRIVPLESRRGTELVSVAVQRAVSAVHSSTRGR